VGWLRAALALTVATVTVAACSGSGGGEKGPLSLASSAFGRGARLPIAYSCAGANDAPPLRWHGATPSGTGSWAIVMTDVDVRPGPWIQWLVTGIPVADRTIAAQMVPARATVRPVSNGTRGFVGACPPTGATHRYAFTVYAVRGNPQLPANANAAAALTEIAKHAVRHATLEARFGR
jgi:Raf kinase inhibitor-like YbhB/YbcL family protein